MNNTRREKLRKEKNNIEAMIVTLGDLKDEEEECYEVIPITLRWSGKGLASGVAIESIREAIECLYDTFQFIETAAE